MWGVLEDFYKAQKKIKNRMKNKIQENIKTKIDHLRNDISI